MKDLVAYGNSGMVLLDRDTDTVIKTPHGEHTREAVTRERQIYERFVERGGHKGILCYHGTFESGIRLEYASHGNVRSYLDDHWANEKTKVRWAVQLAEALEFVHRCGVIHGDVNGFNVLLDKHLDADIFALGSTIYELMTESRPYAGLTEKVIFEKYSKGEFPETESLGFAGSIIKKCWQGEYKECKVVDDLKVQSWT
ncbi:hypothetical protein MYCTH_2139278 [Thermothelomyces thermophilus ATCC 42464]|uniref:Protein kinase domain-containing protein n=1 Tax=Thermothelomyces thermophilus (strain ATCC 42464 / BCRC 31852 / DSM 1799) TaxID=573729 RepID=G2QCF4_THET4|nr:uncharacterized protein MYCTH_2139278 [Thermothelomyces thermophilus ATCC 42464]AEO58130.1 hypothetical protein MYCTH_2139278 [Thermothelomyces thermophilus ATCC 42464]